MGDFTSNTPEPAAQHIANTVWWRAVVSLPLILVGGGGLVSFGWPWGMLVLLGVILITQLPGRMFALLMAWACWIGFVTVLATMLPIWAAGGAVVLGALLVTAPVVRIGQAWGQARCHRMAQRGRPMREWQWVYTGRSFAQAHPLARLSPGIWLICLAMALIPALWWVDAQQRFPILPKGVLFGGTVYYALTLLALIRRWPVAYPMVFLGLAPALPFSFPLMFYWADGVRPNLIYRHRFERLIPEENVHV